MENTMMRSLVTLMVLTWVLERDKDLADDPFFVESMTQTLISFEKKHIINVLTVRTIEETWDYLMDQAFAEAKSDAKIPSMEGQ